MSNAVPKEIIAELGIKNFKKHPSVGECKLIVEPHQVRIRIPAFILSQLELNQVNPKKGDKVKVTLLEQKPLKLLVEMKE